MIYSVLFCSICSWFVKYCYTDCCLSEVFTETVTTEPWYKPNYEKAFLHTHPFTQAHRAEHNSTHPPLTSLPQLPEAYNSILDFQLNSIIIPGEQTTAEQSKHMLRTNLKATTHEDLFPSSITVSSAEVWPTVNRSSQVEDEECRSHRKSRLGSVSKKMTIVITFLFSSSGIHCPVYTSTSLKEAFMMNVFPVKSCSLQWHATHDRSQYMWRHFNLTVFPGSRCKSDRQRKQKRMERASVCFSQWEREI